MSRLAFCGISLAVLLSAGIASAHAFPVTARPAAGSHLSSAPTRVVIRFSEALEPHFTRLEVLDAKGRRVDRRDDRVGPRDSRRLSVDLPPLKAGTYEVVWHATSVDTHQTRGHYHFTIISR